MIQIPNKRSENPPYAPSFFFRNHHINTIFPNLFRKVPPVHYSRERISTGDGDFLDLDHAPIGSCKALVLVHGMEGNSMSTYMQGMVKAAHGSGLNTISLNLRGCSGEMNNKLESYHSGRSDDLEAVIDHLLKNYEYHSIYILGFSLGGNIVLKYAGERGEDIPGKVKAVGGISVPCHLHSASLQLNRWYNHIYLNRFLKTLKNKALLKKEEFPDAPYSKPEIKNCKTVRDFDDRFTAPVHGYNSAEDYYAHCSSSRHLSGLEIPSVLINAADDPFLSPKCFPVTEARNHKKFKLVIPRFGGHVGFSPGRKTDQMFWHEKEVLNFFKKF